MIPLVGIAGAGLAVGVGSALLDSKRDEGPFEGGKPNTRSAATIIGGLGLGAAAAAGAALLFTPLAVPVAIGGALLGAGALAGAAGGSMLLGNGKSDKPDAPADPAVDPSTGTGLEPGADAGDVTAPVGPGAPGDTGWGDPAMADPAMSDPAMGDPAMSDPAMSDPAMSDPAMGDPAMSDPMMSDPYADDASLGKGGYATGAPTDMPVAVDGSDPAFDMSAQLPDGQQIDPGFDVSAQLPNAQQIDPGFAAGVGDNVAPDPGYPTMAPAADVTYGGGKGGMPADVAQSTPYESVVQEPMLLPEPPVYAHGAPIQEPLPAPAPASGCAGPAADMAGIAAAADSAAAAIEAYGAYASTAPAPTPTASDMAATA